MRRLLVAVDGTPASLRAVEYVARQFAGLADLEVTVLHVLPEVPALFWDDGHILGREEEAERRRWLDSWLEKHRRRMAPVLQAAAGSLAAQGFRPEQVRTKLVEDAPDVAQGILDEARAGGHQTIVIGRRGIAAGRHLLLGSVTSRIVHLAAGVAVCVVE